MFDKRPVLYIYIIRRIKSIARGLPRRLSMNNCEEVETNFSQITYIRGYTVKAVLNSRVTSQGYEDEKNVMIQQYESLFYPSSVKGYFGNKSCISTRRTHPCHILYKLAFEVEMFS